MLGTKFINSPWLSDFKQCSKISTPQSTVLKISHVSIVVQYLVLINRKSLSEINFTPHFNRIIPLITWETSSKPHTYPGIDRIRHVLPKNWTFLGTTVHTQERNCDYPACALIKCCISKNFFVIVETYA